MFLRATKFNQPLDSWNISKVKFMTDIRFGTNLGMFQNATSFNQDISTWNVAAVEKMQNMFNGATKFNCFEDPVPVSPPDTGNIQKWKVSGDTDVTDMFANAPAMDAAYAGGVPGNGYGDDPVIDTFFGK